MKQSFRPDEVHNYNDHPHVLFHSPPLPPLPPLPPPPPLPPLPLPPPLPPLLPPPPPPPLPPPLPPYSSIATTDLRHNGS